MVTKGEHMSKIHELQSEISTIRIDLSIIGADIQELSKEHSSLCNRIDTSDPKAWDESFREIWKSAYTLCTKFAKLADKLGIKTPEKPK